MFLCLTTQNRALFTVTSFEVEDISICVEEKRTWESYFLLKIYEINLAFITIQTSNIDDYSNASLPKAPDG